MPENASDLITDNAHGLVGKEVASRYRVIKKLGEGGMGTVYLAEHMAIEKKVALKVLLHEYARKEDLKERFLQEAKAAARIGHENIVDITDFGSTPDGSVFFAMEFLDGHDLSHVIRHEGPMTWTRAKPILLQICRALGAAHSKEIIHRDMKPENIFLVEREGRKDVCKLLDFGIAKVSSIGEGERRLTRTGMIFGTPEYMSPEQAQGHHPDHRVDVYAVGVIMYEMLTGEVPFKADTFMGILTKHIFEHPVPPSKLKPQLEIPADVEAIVLKAMTKDREDRFRSMSEMAAAISQCAGRGTRASTDHTHLPRMVTLTPNPHASMASAAAATATGPIDRPESIGEIDDDEFEPRRSKNGMIVAIALGVLGVVAVGAWVLMSKSAPEKSDNQVAAVAAPSQPKTTAQRNAVTEAASTTRATGESANDKASAATSLSVTIDSTPQKAQILLGDQQLGVTPQYIKLHLPEGTSSVLITLKKDGYEERKLVVTAGDQGKTLSPELTALAKPAAPPVTTPTVVHRTKSRGAGRTGTNTQRGGGSAVETTKPEAPSPPTDTIKRTNDLMDPFSK